MNTRLILLIIALLILLPVLAFLYTFYQNQTLTNTPPTAMPETAKPKATKTASPAPSSISKPAPTTTKTLRGTVTAISGSIVFFSHDGKVENLSLKATTEVYKLTGGTIENGDAKTSLAKPGDIKAGQEALVIADKDSDAIQRLVIIK